MGLETETIVNLCTSDDVIAELSGIDALDTEQVALINKYIAEWSQKAMIEHLKRPVLKAERSEYFDVVSGQREFLVNASPIDTDETITIVNNTDTPRVWSDSSDVISSDYVICGTAKERAERGVIYIEESVTAGVDALKITYTGGMALNTAGVLTAYPSITHAMAKQVAFVFTSRRRDDKQSYQTPGGVNVSYAAVPVGWLNNRVVSTLQNYGRRRNF